MEHGCAAERAEWMDYETSVEQDEQYFDCQEDIDFDCQEEILFHAGVGERDPWEGEGKRVTKNTSAAPQASMSEPVEDDNTRLQKNPCSNIGGSREQYAAKLLPPGHVGGLFIDDYTQRLLEERTKWPYSLPHTRCVPLTVEQLKASDTEFLIAASGPWKGSMCHACGDIDCRDDDEEDGSWRDQRLYT